ncbi:MAG: hypothetical protein ACI9LM_002568 [Alteromonadaceae bacterium]|jgi:hypothetical protein
MNKFKLSFCEVILLEKDIAEVIVDDGVEVNLLMVEEYHAFLLKQMTYPFSLLINKKNSYSYTFEAQLQVATLSQINVMAVIAYTRTAEISTKNLASFTREIPWQLEVFNERELALHWLYSSHKIVALKTTS